MSSMQMLQPCSKLWAPGVLIRVFWRLPSVAAREEQVIIVIIVQIEQMVFTPPAALLGEQGK